MSFDHPVLLAFTALITAWPALRFARYFFGTFLDFIDYAGFGSPGASLFSSFCIAVDQYPYDPDFFRKLLGFLLSVATVAGTVYHVLLFLVTGSFH